MSAGSGLGVAAVVFQAPGFGWLGSIVVALCVVATVLAYTVGGRTGEGARRGDHPRPRDGRYGGRPLRGDGRYGARPLHWRGDARPTHLGLLALRLGAIVCLFLTLLHPACVSRRTIAEKPIVAIVLDDSASMREGTRPDVAAGPRTGRRVAAGPRAGRPEVAAGPRAGRPEVAAGPRTGRPEVAAGLRTGRPDVAAGLRTGRSDDGSRYARAVAVLREEVLPTLAERHRLRLYDVEARALRLRERLPAPVGKRSPLTDTLLHVQADLVDEPLVGIVLLSDGAETTDRPTLGGLEQLRVPVHTIDVCSPDPSAGTTAAAFYDAGPPDLAIQGIAANRRALAGNTVRVAVDISADGDPGEAAVPITLFDGDKTVASRMLRWGGTSGGDTGTAGTEPGRHIGTAGTEPGRYVGTGGAVGNRRHRRVELDFVPRRPGEFTLVVSVGGLPNEIDLANNRGTFPLTVVAEPLTVLYVDGVLRWEGKFIREALAADPDINVVSSVRTAARAQARGSPGLLLPEQLANVDVVILGDVEATYFTSGDELHALSRWVTEDGGGLVLTGGYYSFGPEGFGHTALRDVLPVQFSAAASPQIEQPFNLKLTDAGREHPLFHLTGDRVRDTAFFHKLPPLGGCSRVAGVKPGAEVLAVNPAAALRTGPQIGGPDGTRGLPVMVVQQVGAGRSMVLAVDTTWRWRTIVGGFTGDSAFYERFWGQLVRWMASSEADATQQLFAATDRSRYQLGETIELSIETRAPASKHDLQTGATDVAAGPRTGRPDVAAGLRTGRPAHAWEVTARALGEAGEQMDVPLAELADGEYRGTLAARWPGRVDLIVTATPADDAAGAADADARAQSQVLTVEVQRPDVELRNPRPDPQWLARVSQLSGGRSIRPRQMQAVAAQLPADPVPTTVVRTSGPRGDWLFGSVFVALLCAEWILRRRSQLA